MNAPGAPPARGPVGATPRGVDPPWERTIQEERRTSAVGTNSAAASDLIRTQESEGNWMQSESLDRRRLQVNEGNTVAEQVGSVEARIGVPAVLFNIARLWKPGMDEDALYDVTHGYWRMGLKREQADYALAVAGGQIRAAFRVLAWRARRMGDRDWEHATSTNPVGASRLSRDRS